MGKKQTEEESFITEDSNVNITNIKAQDHLEEKNNLNITKSGKWIDYLLGFVLLGIKKTRNTSFLS